MLFVASTGEGRGWFGPYWVVALDWTPVASKYRSTPQLLYPPIGCREINLASPILSVAVARDCIAERASSKLLCVAAAEAACRTVRKETLAPHAIPMRSISGNATRMRLMINTSGNSVRALPLHLRSIFSILIVIVLIGS